MAKKKSGLSVRGGRAEKNAKRIKKKTRKIDFSDIPELSDHQLGRMRRVGRPPLGEVARQMIALRIDPSLLSKLQEEAQRTGKGYQTLIHEILAEHTGLHHDQ